MSYDSKYTGQQVEALLGKADTALQTEQYKGTVTGVKINGSTKNPSNGVVDLGTVITSHQSLSGKQDKLVSGTNIKTINGQSILGSGDIPISGGGGSDKVEAVSIYPVVNGTEWTYQIPAGKFVELWIVNGNTAPSRIYLELLDPVETMLESESDWVTEYSKYHFVMSLAGAHIPIELGTNKSQNAEPVFRYNGTLTGDASFGEFDVLCSLVHYPASMGYPDMLVAHITMA